MVSNCCFFVVIGIEEELGVVVDGDEGFDVFMVFYKVYDRFDFYFRIGRFVVVSFRVGVVVGFGYCGRRVGVVVFFVFK